MEDMGTITYELNDKCREQAFLFPTRKITDKKCHCETFIAATYDDGHGRSGDRITSVCIIYNFMMGVL